MEKPKLTLYIDIVSPFAYLAFHLISVSIHELSISSSALVTFYAS